MTPRDVALLKQKRAIGNPYMSVTSNDLARELRKRVAEGDKGWSLHKGNRVSAKWGRVDSSPIDLEEFLVTFDRSKHYNHDLLSTFENNIDVDLVQDGEKEVVKLTVWDGDNFRGGRTGVRCYIYLKGPWWTIKAFQELVEQQFCRHVAGLEQVEEEMRRAKRRGEIYEAVLAGTYEVNKE